MKTFLKARVLFPVLFGWALGGLLFVLGGAGRCGRRAGPELHRAVGCLFAHDARGLPCGRSAAGVLPPHHPAGLWRGGGRDAFHSAAGWGAGRHAVSVCDRGADGHSAADSGHKAAQKDAENR